MVRCKKCGLDSHELTWDQEFHEIGGKWRLFHKGQGRPHECHIQKSQETVIENPKPLIKCPKCNPLNNNAWMKRETLQEHLKTEHFGFW